MFCKESVMFMNSCEGWQSRDCTAVFADLGHDYANRGILADSRDELDEKVASAPKSAVIKIGQDHIKDRCFYGL